MAKRAAQTAQFNVVFGLLFVIGTIGVVLSTDSALAQSSKAKKSKRATTIAASVAPVCAVLTSNTMINGSPASAPFDFGDAFATIDTVSGWVEGRRPSTGQIERLTMPIGNMSTFAYRAGGSAASNQPTIVQDELHYSFGDQVFFEMGRSRPKYIGPIALIVAQAGGRPSANNPNPDPLTLTAFQITVCGARGTLICQRLAIDQTNRFAPSARITLPGAPHRLANVIGWIAVANADTARGINSSFRAGASETGPNWGAVPRTIGTVDSLEGSHVEVAVVPANWRGPFTFLGGVRSLALGDSLKTGDYVTSTINWPGAPTTPEPNYPNIVGNFELCVTK